MPFTFHIGNHSCQISEKHLRDIIDCAKKTSVPILRSLSRYDHFRGEMKTVHDGAPFLDILNLLMPPDLKQEINTL